MPPNTRINLSKDPQKQDRTGILRRKYRIEGGKWITYFFVLDFYCNKIF